MATAPARRRPTTRSTDAPKVSAAKRSALSSAAKDRGTKVQGGRRPAWVTDQVVAEEAARSQRLATRRGRAGERARVRAKKLGSTWGKRKPRGGGTSTTPARYSAGPGGLSVTGGRISTDTAGVLLAVFTWSWVILPAVTGGPAAVRDTLRAKFFNKDAAGEFLQ